jgi:peptidoglycan/xylan/chitin deacetylase (PgdA/CDA1 family)
VGSRLLAGLALPAAALALAACGSSERAATPPLVPTTAVAVKAHAPAASAAPRRVVHRARAEQRRALPAVLPERQLHVPILMYHRIDVVRSTLPAITRSLTVDPTRFAAQMRWLVAHGYHSITQEQLYGALEQGRRLPRRPILITFDDGYRDVLRNAAPTIRRLGLHATEYVITGRTSGPDPSFLAWSQLPLLEHDGIEIGSHTVTHADLPAVGASDAWHELLASRLALERHLGHPVQWLAYPYGKFDTQIEELARRAGYVLAVTTSGGVEQDASSPLALHREEVVDTSGVAGLGGILPP